MQVIVKNFRGISEAQIDIAPIALITGKNGAGKTSIALAIAAAATGEAIPFAKLTKKECDIMLRNGTKAAMVALGTGEGSRQVEWPKAESHSDGRPPVSSKIAAGLTDIFAMKEKDALAYMIDLLKARVTREDFAAAFINQGIPETTAEKVWQTIEAQGWDAGLARAKETGTKLKGAWEHITGEKYGSKKAADWHPAEWQPDLKEQTSEDLQAALASARKKLEEVIGKNAVSQAETASLTEKSATADQLEERVKTVLSEHNSLAEKLQQVETKLKNSPNPSTKVDYSCPHCEGLVHITAVSGSEYVLTKAMTVDEAKLKEARLAHASLCGEQNNLRAKLAAKSSELKLASAERDNALSAKQRLESMGDVAPAQSHDQLAMERELVRQSEQRLVMFEKQRDASKTSEQITTNQIIIDLLDETGIRKHKLSQALDAFLASYVAPLCETLGMQPIYMDCDLNVAVGSVYYQMLSASEQFRVRTVLQLAIARLESASVVIIDGADILDQGGRGKLLAMVKDTGLPTIICMTLNKPDAAPDLAAAGIGETYWIENGACRAVSSMAAKEAA